MNFICENMYRCFVRKNMVLLKRTVTRRYFFSQKQLCCIPLYRKVVCHSTLPASYVVPLRHLTTNVQCNDGLESLVEYETVSEETLQSITERFEEIIEAEEKLADSDVSYSDGVLKVNLGKYGTYVINKQTPNRQIWFSSPIRYTVDGYKQEESPCASTNVPCGTMRA